VKAYNIVALVLCLVSAAARGAETCTHFRYVNHRIVVQVKINGYGPFNLLLVTGTQTTIIDPKVYAQVGESDHAPLLKDKLRSHCISPLG
jgi:hypothetical protein